MAEKKGASKANQRRGSKNAHKYALYLTRATCVICNKVFRSPKKYKRHADSGHKSLLGWNQKRARKGSL